MKPSFDLPRVAIIGSALAFSLLLSACGQKGPLYMPKIPPLATTPAVSGTDTSKKPETPAVPPVPTPSSTQ
ncbi:LPS translocon maturation chaperone LptM [Glaciimonas sp. GG7]